MGKPGGPAGATVFVVLAPSNFIHELSCPLMVDR